jgi:hypothetical protein
MSKIISPIAIDMGAKNTGVYYAKYERGTTFFLLIFCVDNHA